MLKILIADDHSATRLGMKVLVRNIFPGSHVDDAADGNATVEKLKSDSFDLILLDINMPHADPVNLMNWITTFSPSTKVLTFSMAPEEVYGKRFLQMGAKGYLKKSASEEEITRALKLVMGNRKYISPELADLLSDEIISGKSVNPFDDLSTRELEIAQYLIRGHSLNELGKLLNIQYSTVCTHKQNIFEKLRVSNVLQLSSLARNYGLETA